MSNETQQTDALTKTPATTTVQGFGAALMQARKKRVMSIEDAAAELNILKRHVEALENENYAALPQYAFARGFVGNYAKLLGLDSDEIMRQFEAGYPSDLRADSPQNIKAPVQPMGTLHRGRGQMKVNFGLIAGILAVLVFGALILKMISSAKDSQSEEATTQTIIDNNNPLSASEQAQGAAIGNAGSALNVATEPQPATNALPAVSGETLLDFWVKQSTTIEVTNGSGNKVMTGTKNRGGYQVKALPPITIEITNPDLVDLNINQQPTKLAEHTVGDKAVLRLQ